MDLGLVADAIRHAHAETVAPRFGVLTASEIEEKSPGDLVTIADRECERSLSALLRDIVDAPVLGEEAASVDPTLVTRAMSAETTWLVDPIDGTSNFAAGLPDYAVMVAHLRARQPVAAWIFQPEFDRMAIAGLGAGATLNGRPVSAPEPGSNPSTWSGVIKDRFLPQARKAAVARGAEHLGEPQSSPNCAGIEYPALVGGQHDFLLYWRTLPWDHAPGVLYAAEAGCLALRPDGSDYRVDDGRDGLVVANRSIAAEVADRLFGDDAEHVSEEDRDRRRAATPPTSP